MVVDPSVALIFGGCCSNVFALEAIVKYEPDSGMLITVTQLLVTALISLPSQLERIPPAAKHNGHASPSDQLLSFIRRLFPYRIRQPQIPLFHLTVMAFLFCAVNMLNNWAFAFDISVPMHIILRSFGSVTTLTVGWLAGKTYSRVQVASVLALTVGVVVSAWADAAAKGASMSLTSPSDSGKATSSFVSGLVVLFVAQLLGAMQGIYTEQTYAIHGRHWLETMFYSHFLGVIFSLVFLPSLRLQLSRLLAGPRFTVPSTLLAMATPYLPSLPVQLRKSLASLALPGFPVKALLQRLAPWSAAAPSTSFLLLLANAATQVLCISGVNRLAARTTAVTVTVVLNIRKLASFLLSCILFGNKLSGKMMIGAAIVFASGGVYGWDSSQKGKDKDADKSEDETKKRARSRSRRRSQPASTRRLSRGKKSVEGLKEKPSSAVPVSTGEDGVGVRASTRRRRTTASRKA